jgi:hypothetical protein
MDFHQVGYWLFCTSLFFAPLLVRAPFVRRLLDDTLDRLGGPEDDPGASGDDFDRFPDRWSALIRRDRLVADVQRLQRIVATDMGMSATRQLGNRLAYNQLLQELRDLADLPAAVPAVAVAGPDRWWVPPSAVPARGVTPSGDWRPLGKVETLEIGRRR